MVGLPFSGALSLASCNEIYYVFLVCVSLLKIENLGISFDRTYVKECFSSFTKVSDGFSFQRLNH